MISPGAVATELTYSATEPDVIANMHKFYETVAVTADSFARMVAFVIRQPKQVDVNEILFRPPAPEP